MTRSKQHGRRARQERALDRRELDEQYWRDLMARDGGPHVDFETARTKNLIAQTDVDNLRRKLGL